MNKQIISSIVCSTSCSITKRPEEHKSTKLELRNKQLNIFMI